MAGPFIWTNLNSPYPRVLCVKFDWNRPSGSGEQNENMKSLRQRQQQQWRQHNEQILIRKAHLSIQLRWAKKAHMNLQFQWNFMTGEIDRGGECWFICWFSRTVAILSKAWTFLSSNSNFLPSLEPNQTNIKNWVSYLGYENLDIICHKTWLPHIIISYPTFKLYKKIGREKYMANLKSVLHPCLQYQTEGWYWSRVDLGGDTDFAIHDLVLLYI